MTRAATLAALLVLGVVAVAAAGAPERPPEIPSVLADDLQSARAIPRADIRAEVIRRLAWAQASAGDRPAALRMLDQALDAARRIDDTSWRQDALVEVIDLRARLGDPDGALKRARGVGCPGGTFLVVQALCEAGDIVTARRIAATEKAAAQLDEWP